MGQLQQAQQQTSTQQTVNQQQQIQTNTKTQQGVVSSNQLGTILYRIFLKQNFFYKLCSQQILKEFLIARSVRLRWEPL